MLFFDIEFSMFLSLFWTIWGSTRRAKFVLWQTFGYPGLTLAAHLAHLAPHLQIFDPIMANLTVWGLIWRAFWSLKITIWRAWKHINLILKWDNLSRQWIDLKTEPIHLQSPEFKLIHFQSAMIYRNNAKQLNVSSVEHGCRISTASQCKIANSVPLKVFMDISTLFALRSNVNWQKKSKCLRSRISRLALKASPNSLVKW